MQRCGVFPSVSYHFLLIWSHRRFRVLLKQAVNRKKISFRIRLDFFYSMTVINGKVSRPDPSQAAHTGTSLHRITKILTQSSDISPLGTDDIQRICHSVFRPDFQL